MKNYKSKRKVYLAQALANPFKCITYFNIYEVSSYITNVLDSKTVPLVGFVSVKTTNHLTPWEWEVDSRSVFMPPSVEGKFLSALRSKFDRFNQKHKNNPTKLFSDKLNTFTFVV